MEKDYVNGEKKGAHAAAKVGFAKEGKGEGAGRDNGTGVDGCHTKTGGDGLGEDVKIKKQLIDVDENKKDKTDVTGKMF